jgi:alpha-beta hydrolase superfamily lysophospholipase
MQDYNEFEIALNGATLRGWSQGSGSEPRGVAILHGLGDHAGRYVHVGRALATRGFAAQALDLPGHGKSEGRRGHVDSWNEYLQAVSAWMDRARSERPERRWSVLGQSMGALVALDWALDHPERVERLILCAPPFQLVIRPSMIKVRAAQVLVRFWPGFSQGNMILPSMLSHDPEIVRAHMNDPLVHYRITARLFFEMQASRAAAARRARDLKQPTLLLHGGADPIADASGSARWARSTPDAIVTLRLYPGLYHEPLAETDRVQIISSMIDWLETPSAAGRGARA